MRRDLAELPGLYDHCEAMLVRFPPPLAQKVTGGGATGLVLDERLTDARRDILRVLASWSGLVADERGVARPGRRDVTELSAFLTAHADWLLAHPAGSCFAEELGAVAAAAREASGNCPSRQIELGRCLEEGCDHTVTATRIAGGISSSVEVRCAAGHVWQARQWLHLARRLRARQSVPTEQAALAAGVSVATIRKWASRGKLSRYGTPGRAEYDLDELFELVPEKG